MIGKIAAGCGWHFPAGHLPVPSLWKAAIGELGFQEGIQSHSRSRVDPFVFEFRFTVQPDQELQGRLGDTVIQGGKVPPTFLSLAIAISCGAGATRIEVDRIRPSAGCKLPVDQSPRGVEGGLQVEFVIGRLVGTEICHPYRGRSGRLHPDLVGVGHPFAKPPGKIRRIVIHIPTMPCHRTVEIAGGLLHGGNDFPG